MCGQPGGAADYDQSEHLFLVLFSRERLEKIGKPFSVLTSRFVVCPSGAVLLPKPLIFF